jgi:hypothetical protein
MLDGYRVNPWRGDRNVGSNPTLSAKMAIDDPITHSKLAATVPEKPRKGCFTTSAHVRSSRRQRAPRQLI